MADTFRIITFLTLFSYTPATFAQGLQTYEGADTTRPFGMIRYEGVVNACIYLIDGKYVESDPGNKTKIDSVPTPVKVVMVVALLPIFLLKGLFSLGTDKNQGYPVSPGNHRVRIGYWSKKTKWIAKDFNVHVKAGQAAVIKTIVTENPKTHSGKEVARIEHRNLTVYFDVQYEPLKNKIKRPN